MNTTLLHTKTLFFPILLLLLLLSGCYVETEVEIEPLQLSRTAIEIENGSQTEVLIESGNGSYLLSIHPSDIATATLIGKRIEITAHTWGEAVLLVTDQKGKRASLDINVTPAAVSDVTPQFVWNNSFELEQPNGWSITYREGRVALTNIDEKLQYILTWEGDFSAGQKQNGVLTIVESNQLVVTHTLQLSSLTILAQDPRYYSLLFFKDDKEGKLVFAQ